MEDTLPEVKMSMTGLIIMIDIIVGLKVNDSFAAEMIQPDTIGPPVLLKILSLLECIKIDIQATQYNNVGFFKRSSR